MTDTRTRRPRLVWWIAIVIAAAWTAEGLAAADAPAAPGWIQDVVLEPGGVLRGRVASATSGLRNQPRRVYLVRQDRVVSEALTDASGSFRMQRLMGGMVLLAVDDPTRPGSCPCRLWMPQTAPPGAATEALVSTGVVRSQNASFLTMGFPQAATLAGVAAGGIVSPIAYQNIQQSHKPPKPPVPPVSP